MARYESWFAQDLKKPISVQMIKGNLFSADVQSNLVGVRVFDDGETATLSGTVSANIIRPDGGTVAATGTLSGNECSVVLPAAAYAYPGVATIVIKLTDSGVVTTLLAVVVTIYRTSTDTAVDPGTIIPSIQTLLDQIDAAIASVDAAIASIPADYSSLWTTLAPAYTSLTFPVKAGQHCTNGGVFYRAKQDIATSEEFTSSHWDVANIGNELSSLKSALDAYENAFDDYLSIKIEPVFTGSKAINSNGEYVSGSYCATAPYYSIENAVIGGKIHGRVEKVSGGKDLVIKPYFYSSESEASNVPSATDERVREDDFSFTVPTGAKYVRFYVYKYDWSSTKPTDIESVYFYDYSNIKELNDNSDTILGLIPTVNSLSEVVKTTGKVTFEQGSYQANGSKSDRNDRIRGQEYIAVDDIFSVTVDSGFIIWYNEYNASKTNLRQNTSSNTKLTKDSFSQDAVYVRFIVRYVTDNTNITPSTNTGFLLKTNIGKVVESIQKSTDELVIESTGGTKNRFYSALKRYSFVLDSATVVSDQTAMENKLLCFTSGNDERTENGQIKVFTYGNGFDHEATASKTLYHRLGHCNSVDYNEDNDCLILGNGSGSYTLAGEIFIVPNFKSIINGNDYTVASNPLTLSNSNAIVIDCSSYDLGTKFNVIWGERNGTKNNIAYLLTAKYGSSTSASDGGDNGTIRRILLGMGTNELEMGSLIQAEADEFNGTFKITDTYTQPGTSYAQCNQGCCFYDGKIYSCIGHDGVWLWAMNLDNTTHRIWYEEFKQKTFADDGSVVGNNQANTTGICYHDGYFFIGMLGVGIVAIKEF